MRKGLIAILSFWAVTSSSAIKAQPDDPELIVLKKLDTLQKSTSIARHFASIYFETTERAITYSNRKNESSRDFMERMETTFASYFFYSANAFNTGSAVAPAWKTYYADTTLSALQYQLLGINAHINGDIWQALVNAFSEDELQNNRKNYFHFQKELVSQYRGFYDRSIRTNLTTRLLHKGSLGLSKWYGNWMLKRWRKRQWKLAILYYNDQEHFQKRLQKLTRKMDQINDIILRHL